MAVVGATVTALAGILVAGWMGRYEPMRVSLDEGAVGGFYVYVWDRWKHRTCRHYFGSDGTTQSVGFQCFLQGTTDLVRSSTSP